MLNFVSDMDRENTCKDETCCPKDYPALQCLDVHKEVCREHKEYNQSDRISESNEKCLAFGYEVRLNIYVSCCYEEEEEE